MVTCSFIDKNCLSKKIMCQPQTLFEVDTLSSLLVLAYGVSSIYNNVHEIKVIVITCILMQVIKTGCKIRKLLQLSLMSEFQ